MSAPLPPRYAQAIQEAKTRLQARFGARLHDVLLFGSYAWGRPDAESDVDLCVLITGVSHRERGEAIEIVAEVAIERDAPLAPLVWSPEDLATRLSRELLLAEDISARGIHV